MELGPLAAVEQGYVKFEKFKQLNQAFEMYHMMK